LANDTHIIGELELCQILLMNHSTNPWVILVPKRPEIEELFELEPQDQTTLMAEITKLSSIMENAYQPTKLNVAALGNVVPQLHIHIIARYNDDPAWPKPIWNELEIKPYNEIALHNTLQMLREELVGISGFQYNSAS
jgi:diadenosine tetraphosphate (Ap4A) HIT family hydrolase